MVGIEDSQAVFITYQSLQSTEPTTYDVYPYGLIWSMYPDSLYAQRALHAGALGYINKEQPTEQIVAAIRRVCEGKTYLSEETAEQLLGQVAAGGRHAKSSGIDALSDRELEIFRLIGQGLSASRTAHRLHRSTNTVEAHRQRIKRKLNLKGAADLNRAAVQWTMANIT